MANAIFIQNPDSIYRDRPGEAYNFPAQYLGMVKETLGDWVIFYEGKSGRFGYVAVQRVEAVTPDPQRDGWYFAHLDRGSLLQFETMVPRVDASGRTYEERLGDAQGRPFSSGLNTSAVRRLTPREFSRIVDAGLTEVIDEDALPGQGKYELDDPQARFHPAPLAGDRIRMLTRRSYRDAAFQRMVKRAYGGRCAISGLSLRNGGGRAEVVGRLIHPGQRLLLPDDRRDQPHPDYLRYHRENVFGRGRRWRDDLCRAAD